MEGRHRPLEPSAGHLLFARRTFDLDKGAIVTPTVVGRDVPWPSPLTPRFGPGTSWF